MLQKIESEDGQDFVVICDDQSGAVKIWVAHCGAASQEPQPFTIEETKAAISMLQFAIGIAEAEREEMEARNGH
jgi:hypothetical protein